MFVNASKVKGPNNNFDKEICSLRNGAATGISNFAKAYPLRENRAGIRGKSHGVFDDIEMLVGFAMKPNEPVDCLVQEGGAFQWSETTMCCLRNSKVAGSIMEKQKKLIFSFVSLLYSLMLDLEKNLSSGSFIEQFMGA